MEKKTKNLSSKISSKGQITIPADIRNHLEVAPGDFLRFVLEGSKVSIVKGSNIDLEYYKALDSTLSEWNSKEDDEAYSDL